jgi:hypothetical protein
MNLIDLAKARSIDSGIFLVAQRMGDGSGQQRQEDGEAMSQAGSTSRVFLL